MSDMKKDYQAFHDGLRQHFIPYTRKAFQALPTLDRPRILDIGCGTGLPTLHLAELSQGDIVGIDIDEPSLDELRTRVEEAGLSGRVSAVKCSLFDMDFPNESFDIIWAEGSIAAIGFERGLREWRRFLKPQGFLAVHDETGNITEKLAKIADCGYDLVDYFSVSEKVWWNEYYAPLEKRISEIRATCGDAPEARALLDSDEQFLEVFKKNPERYSSVFFIMKKR